MMNENDERLLLERVGRTERMLEHLMNEINRISSSKELFISPFSGEILYDGEKDELIQNFGFGDNIEIFLHKQYIFSVGQLLNLGKGWLSKQDPEIAEKIDNCLRNIEIDLPK